MSAPAVGLWSGAVCTADPPRVGAGGATAVAGLDESAVAGRLFEVGLAAAAISLDASGAGVGAMSRVAASEAAVAELLALPSATTALEPGRIKSTVAPTAPANNTATSKIHGSALGMPLRGADSKARAVLIDETEGITACPGIGADPPVTAGA